MARPSEYNYDLCVEICEGVANGLNIKKVLSSNEVYPSFPTWCKWKRENPELFNLYVKSIQDKADSVDEQIDEIAELLRNKEIEPSSANVLIQTLKWKASKYYPKMFGDRVENVLTGEITTKEKFDLSKLTTEELLAYKELYGKLSTDK